METRVTNGFEWHIYPIPEISKALHDTLRASHRVRIATKCSWCGGYIESSPEEIGPVHHREGACVDSLSSK